MKSYSQSSGSCDRVSKSRRIGVTAVLQCQPSHYIRLPGFCPAVYLPAVHRTGCGSRTRHFAKSIAHLREAGTLAAAGILLRKPHASSLHRKNFDLAPGEWRCRLTNHADREAVCLMFEQTPLPEAVHADAHLRKSRSCAGAGIRRLHCALCDPP